MQRGTRTSIDFIKKMKKLQIISGSTIFVTTNVIGFYNSILHDAQLKSIEKPLDNQGEKSHIKFDQNTLKKIH